MQQVLRYAQQPSQAAMVPAPRQSQTIPVFTVMGSLALALCPSGGAHAQPVGSAYLASTGTPSGALAREEEVTAPEMISEIKETAGLTWAQLAAIFGVSSKSVHNWMGGAGLSEANRHTLVATLDKVRAMAGERGYKIRNAILGSPSSGKASLAKEDGPAVESTNASLRNRIALVENTLEILE